jgi:PKD repeat protein
MYRHPLWRGFRLGRGCPSSASSPRRLLALEPLEDRSLLSIYSFWDLTAAPTTPSFPDSQSVEVGIRFKTDVAGLLQGIRFYKGVNNTGLHVAHLWSESGDLLATANFTNETVSGWQEVDFSTPVFLEANTTYVASYHTDFGAYAADHNYFDAKGVDNGPLHAPSGANGVFGIGTNFPDQSWMSSNYWVDVVFNSVLPLAANAGPNQTANQGDPIVFPGSAIGGVGPYTYSWQFGDGSPAVGGQAPHHAYTKAGSYVATLTVTDSVGKVSTASTNVTINPALSLWSTTATPVVPSFPDPTSVEVGVRFKSDVGGTINGMRFYKGADNTGTHVGHLWSAQGDLLATVTFTNESASGWQEAFFSNPVLFLPNTIYVVSYNVKGGHYAADHNYFDTTGVDNGPLHAPAGANGVYALGEGAVFPNQVWMSSNYWVDVLFSPDKPLLVSAGPNPKAYEGDAVSFAGTVTGGLGPYTYSWDFGDGTGTTGTLTPSHVYAKAGPYVATLTITDAVGQTTSSKTVVAISSHLRVPHIVTPYDSIPDFGASPTIATIKSGNWSDPTTWSLNRVPTAGDVVAIATGTTITYDVVSDAHLNTLEVRSGATLNFRTDVSTRVVVGNFLVLQGGTLTIGTPEQPVAPTVKAEVIFANQAINYGQDPNQYGTGFIGLGKVTIHGAALSTTFVRLAAEPRAGDTTLQLSEAVTGWQPGDRILLPDTRQLNWNERGVNYVPQWEDLTLGSVSPDGKTLFLTRPLQFDHFGARDASGTLQYLPHVTNLTRNVVLRSESPTGTRGHLLLTYRAEVDVEYAQLSDLGRTVTDEEDETTFDTNGMVSHYGTNQGDRYSVGLGNLFGPVSPSPDGYQFKLIGNSVSESDGATRQILWGITLYNSSYGLLRDNVVYDTAGAGIAVEEGTETHNVIAHNFVMRVHGDGTRLDLEGRGGHGFWLRGPDNALVDNVATDVSGGSYSYGFIIYAVQLNTVPLPIGPGADPGVEGQSIQVNMNSIPLRQFVNNEVYGASPNGMTLWWIGATSAGALGDAGTVKDFHVWHQYQWGAFIYETSNLLIDHFVDLGDRRLEPQNLGLGIWFSDYFQKGLHIINADIESQATGFIAPQNSDGDTLIENSYFRNVLNVADTTMATVNGSQWLLAKSLTLRNVRFAPFLDLPLLAISMDYEVDGAGLGGGFPTNLIQKDQVFVYDFNGVKGDNFQVYYYQQVPDFIVPQSTGGSRPLIGSPEAGLTNQQNWDKYGIAIAGAIAPATAKKRDGFDGLVNPL